MSSIISDELVKISLDAMSIKAAQDLASAKAMVVRREHQRKQIRAQLIRASNERSADQREAQALCHPDYIAACEREAEAIEAEAYNYKRSNDARTIMDFKRSEMATERNAIGSTR